MLLESRDRSNRLKTVDFNSNLTYNNCIETEKELKMIATFTSVSKSTARAEAELAIQQFLARGGQVEKIKARKAPAMVMRGKQSGGFKAGTSGFPNPI